MACVQSERACERPRGSPRWLPDGGGPEGDRTLDLCVANAALSQLSYKPVIMYDDSAMSK